MNRRGFLKILTAGIAAVVVPAKLLAIEIKKKFSPHKISPIGKWKKEKKLVGLEKYTLTRDGRLIGWYGRTKKEIKI